MKKYVYGMRLRPAGIGCQPKGFIEIRQGTGRYWDVVVYDRPLTEEETFVYSMDLLQEEDTEKAS